MIQLMHGDCLELMQKIPDQSVDMVMCDLPYGTTQNKWDSVIDLSSLWTEYRRVCTGAIVLTAAQPFTSVLAVTNLKLLKHHWIWKKERGTGFQVAKFRPMMQSEDILSFSSTGATLLYNPQMTPLDKPRVEKYAATFSGTSPIANMREGSRIVTERYPTNILEYKRDASKLHPTQKPVALMEYLIKTYTNEGMTVLDNCMGSGTTGVACANTNRNFIGIERDDAYFKICEQRIYDAELKVEADKIENLFGEVFA